MNGYAFTPVRQPAALGWAPYQNGRMIVRPAQRLGQNGNGLTAAQEGLTRERIVKLATGIAALGGGTWAMMSIPGQKSVARIAVGALGGGLLVAGVTNVVDALV